MLLGYYVYWLYLWWMKLKVFWIPALQALPFQSLYDTPLKFKSPQRMVFIPGKEIIVDIINNERTVTTHLLNPNLWVSVFRGYILFFLKKKFLLFFFFFLNLGILYNFNMVILLGLFKRDINIFITYTTSWKFLGKCETVDSSVKTNIFIGFYIQNSVFCTI